ncbi:BspA family leucine-rich repeat surface protein [Candidatus Enterococcus mansonii]|uniref:Bacterial surface protein 26-residue n=1 Tax=Candidatus Enterococcus mansonii TaxID=1834181 RepID=A0A242CCP5_9ENTE|nr:BspA family leucine-rich repeat surface protein [Enterococcus sp. 4G2_DIV0659]OTO07981.1 hypothetical protein A5880_002251 [Enterococcus sp. 4G2_DIV0659]
MRANVNSRSVFEGLTELTTIEGIEKLDVSSVINMRGMFYNLPKLKTLDLSKWDTSNVTSMYDMFTGAVALTELKLANWNVQKVTTTERMFEHVKSLEKLDLSQWNTRNVTGMFKMFNGMTSLEVLVLGKDSLFQKGDVCLGERKDSLYTGSWVGPNSEFYRSSTEFMRNYNGANVGLFAREQTAELP